MTFTEVVGAVILGNVITLAFGYLYCCMVDYAFGEDE